MATAETAQPADLFAQVDGYDWDNDAEFQGGLQAILGSASSPEQVAHLTLRARCFYYSRKFGTKVDFDGYQAWRSQQHGLNSHGQLDSGSSLQNADLQGELDPGVASESISAPAPAPHGNAPTPASFAEICQLIAEGKPIPGIKEIPDTVLEGQATASSVAKRRKPWEKDIPVSEPTIAAVE
ncbi:hypothetical protein ANO11243_040540 [Dothideomycetidae sp. 11243]|nr:hypothetical protein ANO11243_040540 [fungal sp. No.11243]